jgi:hypothetical protein
MAQRILTLFLALALTPPSARAAEGPITYHTATIVALDPQRRTVTVDTAGATLAALPLDSGVGAGDLRAGDAVLVGERVGDGGRRVVLLRRAATSDAAVSMPAVPAADSYSSSSTRRPMTLVPNPHAPGESRDLDLQMRQRALLLEETPAEPVAAPVAPPPPVAVKTAAIAVETQPEDDGGLEVARTRAMDELEQTLISMDGLIRETDLLWAAYRQGCPTASGVGERSWLDLSSAATATEGPCAERRSQLGDVSARIERQLENAQSRARAASVPPGRIRRLLERYGLEAAAR